ncbi:MAG: hypothetical protein AAGG07_11205 [Planctomycetota bacterium]
MMHLPLDDWQFWVVTMIVGSSVLLAARRLWPKRSQGTRATLTISASNEDGRKSG